MISGASNRIFQREWIEVKGNYGFVKTEYLDAVQKALAEQQKEAAKAYDSFTERVKESGSSVKLTGEQKKYLAEHFDPKRMSKLDYQAFLDKLCEFGVLEEADKEYLGYGVKGSSLDMTPLNRVRTGAYLSPVRENPMGYTDCFSSSRGDAASWAKYLSGVMGWDEGTNSWQKKPEALLFGKVHDVLKAISG
ncbi:MAG: hypothetical protein HFG05_10830 [Oscillibacter sp.]|nr:hypothetical protein [Oscillibacter sp.]